VWAPWNWMMLRWAWSRLRCYHMANGAICSNLYHLVSGFGEWETSGCFLVHFVVVCGCRTWEHGCGYASDIHFRTASMGFHDLDQDYGDCLHENYCLLRQQ